MLAAIFNHFGSLWGAIWASWGIIWAALSAHWSLFRPLLAHLGAILVPLGYTLSYFGPPELILEASRPHFGASGDQFRGPSGMTIHHLPGPGGMREAIKSYT